MSTLASCLTALALCAIAMSAATNGCLKVRRMRRNAPAANAAVVDGTAVATYSQHELVLLPNHQHTPGAVETSSLTTICHTTTKSRRAVTEAVKREVYALYGAVEKPGVCCEVDHLISLELGGSNDVTNLWAQPYEPRPGAHEKDAVENWLHRQVCSGRMPLAEAQRRIAEDWYQLYLEMKK